MATVLGLAGAAWAASARPTAGALTDQEIDAVLSRRAHELKRCYLEHAMRQGGNGNVVLDLEALRGRVSPRSVKVTAAGVKGGEFQRCVERSVYRWRFPNRAGRTLIRTPFLFQHTAVAGAGPSKR